MSTPLGSLPTWISVLEQKAAESPQAELYFEPEDTHSGTVSRVRSRAEFHQRALHIAGSLQSRAERGARVLICLPNGIDYLEAFFGCMFAGMIAVPVYPPHARRAQPQLEAIARNAQAAVLLTDEPHSEACRAFAERTSEGSGRPPHVLVVTRLPAGDWRRPDVTDGTVALLQYTSGSTADPKGVTLTHANLLANQRAIAEMVGQGGTCVSWLPLYHDMGLGSALGALTSSGACALLTPFMFAVNPRSWLAAISHYRARVSASPNFAFDLCVERIGDHELGDLDLSSWQVAVVGAEPVRARTLRAFAKKFATAGFDVSSFRPCYGMAEATLLVTGEAQPRSPVSLWVSREALERGELVKAEGGELSSEVVSCGRPFTDHTVVVVDPESRRICAENVVAEIWVSGPSIARGYWLKPDETRETFAAKTSDLEGSFLRTGDLGALRGGELFVTGRLKDMLIVRGRNYYPQDVELAAESVSSKIVPHSSTAFALYDGENEERAALVLELASRDEFERLAELTAAVRETVQNSCDLPLDLIAFVKRGSSPRTTSGKAQRKRARSLLLEGKLSLIAYWTRTGQPVVEFGETPQLRLASEPSADAGTEDERTVAGVWADVLGLERVGLYESFFDLGGHSMRALELLQRVNGAFGVKLHYKDLYANPTVDGMMRCIQALRHEASIGVAESAPTTETRYPLTGAQRRIWDAFEATPTDTASNIAGTTRLAGPLDRSALKRAMEDLAQRHPALRTRFEREAGGTVWQHVEPWVTIELVERDLSALSPALQADERQKYVGMELLRPFDLRAAPLFRMLLFRSGPEADEIAFVVNHIIGDGWSLSILERELHALYRAHVGGVPANLPPLAASYAGYVRWLDATIHDPHKQQKAAEFWRRRLAGRRLVPAKIPYDFPQAFDPTDTKTSSFRAVVSERATQRIRKLARSQGTSSFVVLFSALARFLSSTLQTDHLVLGIPSANRHEPDFLNVFGYFVDPVVVPIRVRGEEPFSDLVSRMSSEVFASLEQAPFPIEFVSALHDVECPGLRMFHVWYNMTTFGDMTKRVLSDRMQRHISIGPDSKFDFSVYPSEYANAIEITSYYKRALYRPETVERSILKLLDILEDLT